MRKLPSLIFFLFTLLHHQQLAAQDKDSLATAAGPDSLTPFVRKVWEAGAKDQRRSRETYNAGRTAIRQRIIWNALTKTAQEVKLYLGNGINTALVSSELRSIEQSFLVVQDGIFIHKGTAQTERNLSVSSAILYQLIRKTESRKKQIDDYADALTRYRYRIDSLLSDPAIYVFPTDSVSLTKYLTRLRVIVSEGDPTDDALNDKLALTQDLQNTVDAKLYSLKTAYEQIEVYRNNLSHINLNREFADLWHSAGYARPFSEILVFSVAKEQMALVFYIGENLFKLLLLAILLVVTYIGILSLKKKLWEETQANEELQKKLIIRQPIASTLILILSPYQFIFINAPFIFSFCIWLVLAVSLLFLLQGYITRFWLRFWIIISTLFLLACADNFILQASRPERWLMTGLSLAGVVYGAFILLSVHRRDLKERSILIFVRFLVLCEALSFLCNAFGRYNISKALLIAGYTGLVIAILFLWVIRLIDEGLALGSAVYRHPERRLFYINFNRVGHKAPVFLYVLLGIGWLVVVGRNFYAFKRIALPFQDFLLRERTLGDYTFSINNLFLFVLIAFCSLALSRIVSFFAADTQSIHSNSSRDTRKVAPGSWILLIRIVIISLGLFLAFAASGLALDKITIVLGALSVGIGLGLQGLVSNLVSGLIIAFERPVNVGDNIEINGKSGMMKSIGFRSSILTLTDGSCLVVPNGDLLNNHLINWSMSRNIKRIVIPLGVAYGSDLALVKSTLEHIVNGEERIVKSPAPFAIPKTFGDNAIGFELVFWIKHLRDSAEITGAIITAIDQAFREKGIVIPIPQQDIYLHKDERNDEGNTAE